MGHPGGIGGVPLGQNLNQDSLYNLDNDGISQFTYPAEGEYTPNILSSATKKQITPTKN